MSKKPKEPKETKTKDLVDLETPPVVPINEGENVAVAVVDPTIALRTIEGDLYILPKEVAVLDHDAWVQPNELVKLMTDWGIPVGDGEHMISIVCKDRPFVTENRCENWYKYEKLGQIIKVPPILPASLAATLSDGSVLKITHKSGIILKLTVNQLAENPDSESYITILQGLFTKYAPNKYGWIDPNNPPDMGGPPMPPPM